MIYLKLIRNLSALKTSILSLSILFGNRGDVAGPKLRRINYFMLRILFFFFIWLYRKSKCVEAGFIPARKGLNVEHRTSNVERPIWIRFSQFFL